MQNIVVDAGPLIALFRRRDKHHLRVKHFLAASSARLITTLPVVNEVCHFLNAQGKLAFLTWVRRGGLTIQTLGADDFGQIGAIMERYGDRDIDFADASLIWLADRLNSTAVLTLDRGDFEVYRLSNGKAFQIIAQ